MIWDTETGALLRKGCFEGVLGYDGYQEREVIISLRQRSDVAEARVGQPVL